MIKAIEALDLIKAKRKKLDITQKEIANKLGMARSSYQAIESGKNNMSINDFFKIIEILQIPITTFVDKDLIVISKDEVTQLSKCAEIIIEITKKLNSQVKVE